MSKCANVRRIELLSLHVLVISLALLGCGGDGSAGQTTGTTGAGGAASAPPRAVGGAAMMKVQCGASLCEVPPAAGGVVKPCCVDAGTSTCGYVSGFTQNKCTPLGPGDARCPSVMVAGIMAPACCTSKGMCG